MIKLSSMRGKYDIFILKKKWENIEKVRGLILRTTSPVTKILDPPQYSPNRMTNRDDAKGRSWDPMVHLKLDYPTLNNNLEFTKVCNLRICNL